MRRGKRRSKTPVQTPDNRLRPGLLLRSHQEERRRLSLGLHQSITHALAVLSANLDLIAPNAAALSPRASSVLAESRSVARQAFRDSRRLTDQLRPQLVGEAGLDVALRCHLDSFVERTGKAVKFLSAGSVDLHVEVAVLLHRLVEACLEDLPRPLHRVPALVSVMAERGKVTLLVRPVARATATYWRRVCRLQLGDAARVRLAPVPASDDPRASGERAVVLAVTVPSTSAD